MSNLNFNLHLGGLLSAYAIEAGGPGSTVNGVSLRASLLSCHRETPPNETRRIRICEGAYLQGQFQDTDRFNGSAGYMFRSPNAISRNAGLFGQIGLRVGRTLDGANEYHSSFHFPTIGIDLAMGAEYNFSRNFGLYAGAGIFLMPPFPVVGGQVDAGIRVGF